MESASALSLEIAKKLAEIDEETKRRLNKKSETQQSESCLLVRGTSKGGATSSMPLVFFPRNRPEEYVCTVRSGTYVVHCSPDATFCSLFCDVGVGSGKFMYEVKIITDGLFQIGWTTAQLDWSATCGVGDSVGSYGYDGLRLKTWNVGSQTYGARWKQNDIVSCLLDLDEGTMCFLQNGVDLGVAYTDLPRLRRYPFLCDALLYHPGLSMSSSQSCAINFGTMPMVYPQRGYQTLCQPESHKMAKTEYLMECLLSLCEARAPLLSQLVAADAFMQHFSSETFLCFVTLLERAHQKGVIVEVIQALRTLSPPAVESMLGRVMVDVAGTLHGTDLTQNRTLMAIASLASHIGAGMFPNAELESFGLLKDVFLSDGVEIPSCADKTKDELDKIITKALRQVWTAVEANVPVRAYIIKGLRSGHRGNKFLKDLCSCRSLDLHQAMLVAFARYWLEVKRYTWHDLLPAWYLTQQGAEADAVLRLGGGASHLLFTYPTCTQLPPTALSEEQRADVEAFATLMEGTRALHLGLGDSGNWEDSCRITMLFCPATFPEVRYLCRLIIEALAVYTTTDLYRFVPISWASYLVDMIFYLKRLDPDFPAFLAHVPGLFACISSIMADERIVVPDLDAICDLASSLLLERQFHYTLLISGVHDEIIETLLLTTIRQFIKKGGKWIVAVAFAFQDGPFQVPSNVGLSHAHLLSLLFEKNIRHEATNGIAVPDTRIGDIWVSLVTSGKSQIKEVLKPFLLGLYNHVNDATTIISQRDKGGQHTAILHAAAAVHLCFGLRVLSETLRLTPAIFISEATNMTRLCEILYATMRECRTDHASVQDCLCSLLITVVTVPSVRAEALKKFRESTEWEPSHIEDLCRHVSAQKKSPSVIWTAQEVDMEEVRSFMSEAATLRLTRQTSVSLVNECTICARNETDTTFAPCGHSSCYECISRHLESSREKTCFICRQVVDRLLPYRPSE